MRFAPLRSAPLRSAPMKVCTHEVCTFDFIYKICTEVCISEVYTFEVCTRRSARTGIASSEVCTFEVCTFKFCTFEVCMFGVGPLRSLIPITCVVSPLLNCQLFPSSLNGICWLFSPTNAISFTIAAGCSEVLRCPLCFSDSIDNYTPRYFASILRPFTGVFPITNYGNFSSRFSVLHLS